MKTFSIILTALFIFTLGNANATVKSEIENANKAGKAIFLVVTDSKSDENGKALQIANDANASYPDSKVIILDRANTENRELVTKYQLASASLPVILVIASNGVVSGGYLLQQATPDLLVKAIPSPKKADVLKTLSEGKSVFMVVSSKNMSKKSDIVNTCQQACIEMENKAKIIEVNLDDPQEEQFLAELKIDRQITEPKTYVINAQGQLTGTFDSNVNSATLTASAKKVAASGCCAPGSGKSCGPTKK